MRTQEVEDLFVEPQPRSFKLRRFVLAFLAICAVGGIAAIAIIARSRPDAAAQLRIRESGVTVLHGTSPEQAGSEGQDLDEGDVVRTDATGRAHIDLFEGSVVRLDSDSEISLRNLEDSSDGREVSLGLLRGRAWNRVAEQQDGDSYAIDLGEAVVTAIGTTFMTDCTSDPVCFVLGVEGTSVVESTAGREIEVEEDDCVEVDAEGRLETCDADEQIDGWVRENLAEDEQLTFDSTPSPTPSPTATTPVRRRAPAPAGGPAGPPPPTATAAPTDAPTAKPPPKKTKAPAPDPTPGAPSPTDDPGPTGSGVLNRP